MKEIASQGLSGLSMGQPHFITVSLPAYKLGDGSLSVQQKIQNQRGSMKIHNASCLCNGVRFKIKGELRPVIYCHCSQCLKTHGHFAAYTSAVKEQIEWQNQETLCWFDSSEKARRGFCGKCGASLFYELKGGAGLSITAGSIESPTGLHAAGHIYFENHSDYYEVLDQLPKFRENSSEDFPDFKP